MCDGSVRPVSTKLSEATWNSALRPDDVNVLGPDW
jgi:hypothetical protein